MKINNSIGRIFMQWTTSLLLSFCLTFVGGLQPAYAQSAPVTTPAPAPAGPQVPLNLGGFWKNVATSVNQVLKDAQNHVSTTLFNAGLGFATSTTTWALSLGGSLALLYWLVGALSIISKKTSLLQLTMDVGLPAVMAAYFINNYSTDIQQFAGVDNGSVLDYVRGMGAANSSSPLNGTFQMFVSVFNLIATALTNAFYAVKDDLSHFSVVDAIFDLADFLDSGVFGIILLILSLCSMVEILGLVWTGPFLCAIAVAFGPIFIALLVTPWTRNWFQKWLSFLIGSALLTGVVNVVLGIASTVFTTLLPASELNANMVGAGTLIEACGIMLALTSLIGKAPGIAQSLVGGFGSGSSVGGVKKAVDQTKAVKNGAPKAWADAKTTGTAVKNVAKSVGRITSAGMSKVGAAIGGA